MLIDVLQMIVGNDVLNELFGWCFALIVLVTTLSNSYSEYLGWHIRDCKKSKQRFRVGLEHLTHSYNELL